MLFFLLFSSMHYLSVSFLAAMNQKWLSPIGPRVPAVEAHPTAMLPDTESDEEHKAAKAYPESPGEHTHTYWEAGKRAQMHAQRWAGTGSVSQTYTVHIWTRKQTDKHKSRWVHLVAGTLTHRLASYQKHSKPQTNTNTRPAGTLWHSNSLSHQTCNCTLRNKPRTKSIFSLFRSYSVFIYPCVTMGLTSLLLWPRTHYSRNGMNENNIAGFIQELTKQANRYVGQSVSLKLDHLSQNIMLTCFTCERLCFVYICMHSNPLLDLSPDFPL